MAAVCSVKFLSSSLAKLSRFAKGQRCQLSTPVTSPQASLPTEHRLLDPHQVKLLDEVCILVDENDKNIGYKSKRECHLMENIEKGMIHRAFSVFLFNTKGELLIQQRSDAKITFPGYFTNTCCSHPLHTPDEIEETDAAGVKKSALRRLNNELGISPLQVSVKDFHYVTRILYAAPSHDVWGESEIDYILVLQKDVDLSPNPNEIKSLQYIQRTDIPSFLDALVERGEKITPWFKLIADSFLDDLWANLGDLSKMEDHKTIHRMS